MSYAPMPHPFLPAIALVFAPTAYLLWRSGRLATRPGRLVLYGIGGAIAAWSAAEGGLDYDRLKYLKMVLAAVAAIVVAGHAHGGLWRTPRAYRSVLTGLAAAGLLLHTNFLSFHGTGTTREFVHLHDVAHYYLGSKYFREIAHADLYIAMLRAEADRFGANAVKGTARDLRTNNFVDARQLLADSDAVKANFTPTRWRALQEDVAFFKRNMRHQYRSVLRDSGYNPTPLWTVIGGTLTNMVPAGNDYAIRALSLIDPLLEVAMFAAIAWAFGTETALIAFIYFCILFGASFGWLGGAILRHLWFAALIGTACLLHRGKHLAAGGLLALSTGLRVFPAFFALGPLAQLVHRRRSEGSWPSGSRRFASALVVAGAVFLLATAATPRGLESWSHFRTNMQRHVQNIAFNTIGLTHLASPFVTTAPAEGGRPTESAVDKVMVHRVQLLTVFPLSLLWLYRRARQADNAIDAMALGFVPLYTGLDLACYYYVALLLLVLAYRRQPNILALLFTVEAVSYSFRLVVESEATVFVLRSAILLLTFTAIFLAPREDGRPIHAE